MAALAYVLLPLSGTLAFVLSRSSRVRFHGAQAIVVGLVWGAALYAASLISPTITRAVWAAGAVVWILLIAATAIGRDPTLPGLGGLLRGAVATDER